MAKSEAVMKVISAIDGITYLDWIKIKQSIDASFETKVLRQRNTISISPDEVMSSYQSLF